ncbi:MAG: HYR domain-containing protein, partial [Bacteroidales bacterium]|nr:HYR domain-containing protein [Bacteroidales bacterium]
MKKSILITLLLTIGGFTNLYSQCENEKGYYDFPFTENGITVTKTLSGNFTYYSSAYTACGVTEKPYSIWTGQSGPATFRNDFSIALNDIEYNLAGTNATEAFTVTVSNGTPSISFTYGDCPSSWSISGNVLTCVSTPQTAGGAGGRIRIHSTQPYTWISFYHNGGAGGTIFTMCFGAAFQSVLPTVTTTAVTSITGSSASSGGNVTDDGGAAVTARGVCWNTTGTPTIAGSHTSDGTGLGSFSSSITGLSAGTTYYVRAYATNTNGTGYGSQLSFTTSSSPPPTDPTSVTASVNPVCNGSSTQLTAVGEVGTVYWYTGSCGGTLVTTGNPITVNPQTNTTYFARNYANSQFSSGCASVAITVEQTPVAGTLTKDPNITHVCPGTNVKATLSGGSGGNGTNQTEYRTHDGSDWSNWDTYTSDANISTTGKTAVEIRTRRMASYCSNSDYNTVSWLVYEELTLSCPEPIVVNNDVGVCGASVEFSATAGGTPAPTLTYTLEGNIITSPHLFEVGTHTVVVTAENVCGMLNCSFTVTVNDNEPPQINCPDDITVSNDNDVCGAVVIYDLPEIDDNCTDFINTSLPGYTFIGGLNGHSYFRSDFATTWSSANAAAIALGGHLITISSAEENALVSGYGNWCWIGFTDEAVEGNWVWVTGEPVVYTSWGPGEPNNANNEDYAATDWGAYLWNDLPDTSIGQFIVEFDQSTSNQTSGLPSGSVFPVGTTTNTFWVTDGSGNTASCSFTVTVNDTEAPVLSGTSPFPELLYYHFNDSGTSVINLASNPPAGTETATIIGGLSQGGSGICDGSLIGNGGSSANDYLNTHWSPNLNGTSWTLSFKTSNIPTSSTLFYILGDQNAGGFRCFTNGVAGPDNWLLRGGITDVLVPGGATMDPHTITFVYDQSLGNIKAYLDGDLVNTVAQSAANIVGSGPFKVGAYSSSTGLPSGGMMDDFRLYSRALSFDEVLKLNACNQSIQELNTTINACTAEFEIFDPIVDNCSGSMWGYSTTGATILTSSGNTIPDGTGSGVLLFNKGVTTVTLTGTDGTNSATTVSFDVTVVDNQPPTITCPDNISVSNDNNVCGAIVTITYATVTDNCTSEPEITGLRSDNLQLTDPYPVGITSITWTAEDDDSNVSSCLQTITVTDNENPIVITKNISIQLDMSGNAAIVPGDIDNGSTDNCAIATYELDKDTFTLADKGNNTVTLTVTDIHGNEASNTANVFVAGIPAPWKECDTHPTANGTGDYDFSPTNPTFNLTATGLSSTLNDVHHFVYQEMCGNQVTVIARLAEVENGGWAGVMMRQSCSPGSKAILFKTRLYNPNVIIGYRTTENKAMRNLSQVAQLIRWMKIQRNGSNFKVFTSYNGTTWQQRYSGTISMGSCIQAGIFTESVLATRTSMAWFDHVKVEYGLKSGDEIVIDETNMQSEKAAIELYPNPADDLVTISIPGNESEVSYSIADMDGRVIEQSGFVGSEAVL